MVDLVTTGSFMSDAVAVQADRRQNASASGSPKAPAFIAGLGLGGFLDGIVLHQLLQWHHMLTSTGDHPNNTIPSKEANVFADGLFHVATWVLVAVAMMLTVRAWQRRELAPPWRTHFGLLFVGWGVFNVVEGLVNHQLLGIHHVRDDLGGPLSWDIAFLLLGLVLVVIGMVLVCSGREALTRFSR